MNWFATNRQTPIQAPDDKATRPKEWTIQPSTPTISKTRPQSVSEMIGLIQRFEKQEQYSSAVELLKMNSSVGLRMWLRAVMDPNIPWRVDRNVDWEPSNFEESTGALWSNFRKVYLFCEFPGVPSPLANVTEAKLYQHWGNFLSEHSGGEASVLLMASEKHLPFRPEIALEAFPDLLGPVNHREQQVQMASRLRESEIKRLMQERENLKLHSAGELQAAMGTIKSREAMMKHYDDLIARKVSELP